MQRLHNNKHPLKQRVLVCLRSVTGTGSIKMLFLDLGNSAKLSILCANKVCYTETAVVHGDRNYSSQHCCLVHTAAVCSLFSSQGLCDGSKPYKSKREMLQIGNNHGRYLRYKKIGNQPSPKCLSFKTISPLWLFTLMNSKSKLFWKLKKCMHTRSTGTLFVILDTCKWS